MATNVLRVEKPSSLIQDTLWVILGSILLSLCGPLAIPLPFTPVPLALAPQVCLALGAVLGKRRGSLAVLTYLAQGAMGLPVFAAGGFGLLHLLGPKGGYLLGYLAATYFTGALVEKARNHGALLQALLIGNALIFLFGVLQLSLFIGFPSALLLGVLPFIIGDLFKITLVYKGLKRFAIPC